MAEVIEMNEGCSNPGIDGMIAALELREKNAHGLGDETEAECISFYIRLLNHIKNDDCKPSLIGNLEGIRCIIEDWERGRETAQRTQDLQRLTRALYYINLFQRVHMIVLRKIENIEKQDKVLERKSKGNLRYITQTPFSKKDDPLFKKDS